MGFIELDLCSVIKGLIKTILSGPGGIYFDFRQNIQYIANTGEMDTEQFEDIEATKMEKLMKLISLQVQGLPNRVPFDKLSSN